MRDVDGCFHLAAIASVQYSTEHWLEAHRANQSLTVAIFDEARRAVKGKVPVVYASSAAVYGDHDGMRLHEGVPPAPLTAYGVDKLGCELHGKVAWTVHGLPNTGLRLFNVYGPGQSAKSNYAGVINIFADAVYSGRPLTIHGDGYQARDFIFVSDVVEHMIAAMLRQPSGHPVYNVCTGIPTTIHELALLIGRAMGKEPRIVHGPARIGDIRYSLGDPAAAAAALSLRATTSLIDGLRLTLLKSNSE